jgi:hypothetical protein
MAVDQSATSLSSAIGLPETRHRSDPQAIEVNFESPTPVPLDPGVYRVTKAIDLTPGEARPPSMAVSARFRVIAES